MSIAGKRSGLDGERSGLFQRRSKAALDLKVRQDAQGDGEKSGILLASNTLSASKGLVKHLHDKRHYKPLQKNLNKRIRVSGNISEKTSILSDHRISSLLNPLS